MDVTGADGSVLIDTTGSLITGASEDGVNVGAGIGGNVDILNEGGTITGGDDGVYVYSVTGFNADVFIDNDSSGLIQGFGDDGIRIRDVTNGGDVVISNEGGTIIGGGGDGIDIDRITGSDVDIFNAGGIITGLDDGIELDDIDGYFNVDNTAGGSITGTNGDGIDFDGVGAFVLIDNQGGTIAGGDDCI